MIWTWFDHQSSQQFFLERGKLYVESLLISIKKDQ